MLTSRRRQRPRKVKHSDSGTFQVLLVEEHPATRVAMKSLLESHGHRVSVAASREQALHRLRRELRPCLILLDMDMRRQSAYQFRNDLLQDEQLASIPVVVYSGLYDPKIAAGQLRAAAYFTTPVELDRFLGVIETYCARKRSAA